MTQSHLSAQAAMQTFASVASWFGLAVNVNKN